MLQVPKFLIDFGHPRLIDIFLLAASFKGEEVQQVNSSSTEAEGVQVGREFEEPETTPEEANEPNEETDDKEDEGEVRQFLMTKERSQEGTGLLVKTYK
jgi:hypothetical protein